MSLRERILFKVRIDDNGHWLWTGALREDGYAQVRDGNKKRYAHRVAYELLVGPIPEGAELDHLCRVRHCINPQHLEPVTKYENMMRGNVGAAINKRKTKCIRGHNFDVKPNGKRVCGYCARLRMFRFDFKRMVEKINE